MITNVKSYIFFDDKVVKRLSPLVHLRMMTTLRLLVILRPTSLVHGNLRILRGGIGLMMRMKAISL